MDDVLKRLGAVESSISELRVQVSGITATLPHLATKDDLKEVRGEVAAIAARIPYLATNEGLNEIRAIIPHLATNDGLSEVRAVLPHLATSADLNAGIGSLRAEISAMETRMIKWIITTGLTSVGLATGLAFSIARLVH